MRGGRALEAVTHPRWAGFAVFAVVLLAVIDQRFALSVATEGRGTVGLSTFALPILAMLLVLRFGGRALAAFASPAILWWLPYLLLSALLPALAVAIGSYPPRILFAGSETLVALSCLVIGGAAAVAQGAHGGGLPWRTWLAVAALAQAGYALAQSIAVAGAGAGWPRSAILEWDLTTQARFGELVVGRSAGFYVNPNILGLWGAMVVVLGVHMGPGRARLLVIGSGAVSLLLSQSRGAFFALVLALAIALLRRTSKGLSARSRVAGALVIVLALGAGIGGALLTMGILDIAVFERMYVGLAAALGGRSDPGLVGRINLWAAALALLETRPLGTLGPPEFILGAAVDNGWVRVLAQGSIPLTAALGLMLLPGIMGPLAVSGDGERLRSLSVLVALAAMSQTPLSYPPAILYWLTVGAVLAQRQMEAHVAPASLMPRLDYSPGARLRQA